MLAYFQQRDPETGEILRNGGRPQYGYRVVKVKMKNNGHTTGSSRRFVDEAQAEVFRQVVVDLYIGQRLGFAQIVGWLNECGTSSSTEKNGYKPVFMSCYDGIALKWLPDGLFGIGENVKDPLIRSERGKFKLEDECIWVENAHSAILTPEEAEAAIKILKHVSQSFEN